MNDQGFVVHFSCMNLYGEVVMLNVRLYSTFTATR